MAEPAAAYLLRAAEFAALRHRDQRRKGDDESPYINHPVSVAALLATEGAVDDPVVLAAALLHDTLEDTVTTAAEIASLFGTEVSRLVEELTDDKSLPHDKRKEMQVRRAEGYSKGARLIRIADKISNLRDVTVNPPRGWSRRRREEYLGWAEKVVGRCRGANGKLEGLFDRVLEEARRSLGAGETGGGTLP